MVEGDRVQPEILPGEEADILQKLSLIRGWVDLWETSICELWDHRDQKALRAGFYEDLRSLELAKVKAEKLLSQVDRFNEKVEKINTFIGELIEKCKKLLESGLISHEIGHRIVTAAMEFYPFPKLVKPLNRMEKFDDDVCKELCYLLESFDFETLVNFDNFSIVNFLKERAVRLQRSLKNGSRIGSTLASWDFADLFGDLDAIHASVCHYFPNYLAFLSFYRRLNQIRTRICAT